jgi:hypothetical protein
MKATSKARIALACAGLLILAACGRPEPAAPASQQPTEPPDARAVLMDMAEFLAGSERFSVTVKTRYDVLQDSGQKIEFGEVRRITVSRPDRLRVEVEQSDGDRRLALFDGANIIVHGITRNLYAQLPFAGSLDRAVSYLVNDLRIRLPLAMLLVSRLPAELERRVQSVDYVETTAIDGVPAHHLAGRMESVDFQVWVGSGVKPLPQRIVLTYRLEEGQPQFRAQFSDWNLSPRVKDAMFRFTPPPGAARIAFLNQLPPPPSGQK